MNAYNEPPKEYLSFKTFSEIYNLIIDTKYNPQFYYMSANIKDLINAFIKYTNTHLENFEYYQKNNDLNYWNAIEILSKLYPLLKCEIGWEEPTIR